jgi:periplasmic protein TonB
MFEQSVLISHPTNKSWTVLVSLTGELFLLSIAALVPLAYTDHLPSFDWKSANLGPPPRRLEAAPVRNAVQTTTRSAVGPKAFVYPRLRALADLSRLPPEPVTMDAPPANGVEGSIGAPASGPVLPAQVLVERPPQPSPAKPVEIAPSGPIRVSGGVQMAKLIRQVKPEYPALAKAARIYGVVRLVGVIGKDGTIQNLQLISGHALLARAAMEAVRQWVYQPTLLSGEPVEVIAPIDVNFTLTQ